KIDTGNPPTAIADDRQPAVHLQPVAELCVFASCDLGAYGAVN
ncbi:hypothetical protein A2U01_0113790, partial [Trifolium medium]|nr:hypothetical protein [Trifolium medium]